MSTHKRRHPRINGPPLAASAVFLLGLATNDPRGMLTAIFMLTLLNTPTTPKPTHKPTKTMINNDNPTPPQTT